MKRRGVYWRTYQEGSAHTGGDLRRLCGIRSATTQNMISCAMTR
jgi:hypothetical protein